MIIFTSTDKLVLRSSSTSALDVVTSWSDLLAGVVTPGVLPTAIVTAVDTDIMAVPAASTFRNLESCHVFNKGGAANTVIIFWNRSGTLYELYTAVLNPGEQIQYSQEYGFYKVAPAAKLMAFKRVTADSVHATAATFADVTGLTAEVKAGKHYCFEACLFHLANATTTGAQFAINGPTMTAMRVGAIDVIGVSATAAAMGSAVADITARDTAVIVETTGALAGGIALLGGWINPSADGTFAIRATSEVTVAAGLTVKQGSWMQIWESDN
jgi:hypothetical protein